MELKLGMETEYAAYKAVNADDPYSARVVSYGEDWAAAMEAAMALGQAVRDCAGQASKDVDDGITGFMYGAAAQALSRFWKHGDELRAWHNRQYIKDEEAARAADRSGGVVNPAIVTIG